MELKTTFSTDELTTNNPIDNNNNQNPEPFELSPEVLAAQLALKIFTDKHEKSEHNNNNPLQPDPRPIPPTIKQSVSISNLSRPIPTAQDLRNQEAENAEFLYKSPITLYDPTRGKQKQINRAEIEKQSANIAKYRATLPRIVSCYPGKIGHLISCIQK